MKKLNSKQGGNLELIMAFLTTIFVIGSMYFVPMLINMAEGK